jgi:hypothetical protein
MRTDLGRPTTEIFLNYRNFLLDRISVNQNLFAPASPRLRRAQPSGRFVAPGRDCTQARKAFATSRRLAYFTSSASDPATDSFANPGMTSPGIKPNATNTARLRMGGNVNYSTFDRSR